MGFNSGFKGLTFFYVISAQTGCLDELVPGHWVKTAFRWSRRPRLEAAYLLLPNTEDKNK